jgi:hypothetical protein
VLDELTRADAVTTGYQTTDDIPTHLILNGRAVSDKASEAFRNLRESGLVEATGSQVTVTETGREVRVKWLTERGHDPRLARVDLHRL